MKKAQATVEFAIVFAASMLILGILAFIVYGQMSLMGMQKESAEARAALSEISQAAKDVYTQGEGASRMITVSLPPDYAPEYSRIVNNSIVLKVRETYHVENLEFPVYGTLPQAAGVHEITLISRGNSVYVGSALFRMNPQLVSTTITAYFNKTEYVKITNIGNETISVNASVYWPHSGVLLSASETDFELAPYEEKAIALLFTATSMSGGYSGSITFDANSSQLNDTQTLGLYAEIPQGVMINVSTNMTVYPLNWSEVLGPGQNSTKAFVVCANGPEAISNITFTNSSGAVGGWLLGLGAIGKIDASACTPKTITLVVPQSTLTGIYNATITVNGSSSEKNHSSIINISINVLPPKMSVSPPVWGETLGPGATSSKDITICAENLYLNTVTFTVAGSTSGWIAGIMPIGPINSGTCSVKTLNMTVPISASPGTYYGNITVAGDSRFFALINDSVTVTAQNMSVSPSSWNASIKIGTGTDETFMVCAVNVSITNVSFIPSAGAPGSWVGNTTQKGPLQPGSCILKKLTLSIPNGTTPGTYSGNITFSGDNIYNVSVPLGVYAKPPYNNITFQNVAHSPMPAYSNNASITITGFANGSLNNNKNITGCTLLLDNDLAYSMSAQDGAFNSSSENITVNLGQLSKGTHEAMITCADTDEIPSRNFVYDFRVYKTILFVYYGASPTASETSWTNWIYTNSSGIITINQTTFISSAYVNISNGQIGSYLNTTSLNGGAWIVNETGASGPAFDFFFNFTGINSTMSTFAINMYGKYQGKSSHNVYLYLWNYTSSAWTNIGQLGTSDALRWYNFTNLPAASYVQNGAARARVTHTSNGDATHYMLLDYVELYAWAQQTTQFKWFMDGAYASNITAGTVDETFYKMLVFADWSANPPVILGAKANLFLAGNRSIIFLGNALQNAPSNFGAGSTISGGVSDDKLAVVNNTHYITSGFSLANSVISTAVQDLTRFNPYSGTISLGDLASGSSGRSTLAQMNKTFYYGPTNASLLNANGSTFAARILDYALNASYISG